MTKQDWDDKLDEIEAELNAIEANETLTDDMQRELLISLCVRIQEFCNEKASHK